MIPLIILLISFVLTLGILKLIRHEYRIALAARVALAIMLLFTAIGHFAFTKGMALMIPPFIPYKTTLVYLTGLLEIAFSIGLLMPRLRLWTAWLLIAFFLLLLPANIYAAMEHINYQTSTFDGPGSSYLWFRIPMQVFLIAWTYFSSIKTKD